MGTPHDRTVYDSGGWDSTEGGDMTAPSRQPAGNPTGGQFAPDSRREADTRLANPPLPFSWVLRQGSWSPGSV